MTPVNTSGTLENCKGLSVYKFSLPNTNIPLEAYPWNLANLPSWLSVSLETKTLDVIKPPSIGDLNPVVETYLVDGEGHKGDPISLSFTFTK